MKLFTKPPHTRLQCCGYYVLSIVIAEKNAEKKIFLQRGCSFPFLSRRRWGIPGPGLSLGGDAGQRKFRGRSPFVEEVGSNRSGIIMNYR